MVSTSSTAKRSHCVSIVLLYHHLGLPKQSYVPAGHCAPMLLSRQLDFLSERGWQATPLPSLVERCRSGTESQHNEFCLTFDDGYQSVYEVAYPALMQRNMTATVYVVAGAIGRPITWNEHLARRAEPLMTAEQIRELSDNGLEIGSHTISHPRLTDLPIDRLRHELVDSRKQLEDITGKEVVSLSYPYGAYDQRVLHASIEAGYRYAVCMRLGTVATALNLYEIPRISVRWNTIGAVLLRNIGHAHSACQNDG